MITILRQEGAMTEQLCYVLIGLLMALLLTTEWTPEAQAQSVRPPDVRTQYHRAEMAWRSGASLLEAKIRLDRVLEKEGDNLDALKLRSQVLLALDRSDEALEDARRATELAPTDGEAWLIKTEAERGAGEYELARSSLETAAEHLIDDAALHIRLSWNAAMLNHLDRAEAFARIALALDSTDAAHYQLARVFVQQREHDRAAEVLANGLQKALLEPSTIRRDTLLIRVIDHPLLRTYFRTR